MRKIMNLSHLKFERKISHKISGKLGVPYQIPIFYICDVV
jgi:hypothetical protein